MFVFVQNCAHRVLNQVRRDIVARNRAFTETVGSSTSVLILLWQLKAIHSKVTGCQTMGTFIFGPILSGEPCCVCSPKWYREASLTEMPDGWITTDTSWDVITSSLDNPFPGFNHPYFKDIFLTLHSDCILSFLVCSCIGDSEQWTSLVT